MSRHFCDSIQARLLLYQRDATYVSRKPIFSNHDIHLNQGVGVGPADHDADCLERQSWHAHTNELQGFGLEHRIDRQRNGGPGGRHQSAPSMSLSNISAHRQGNARGGSRGDGRRAIAMQRDCEQQPGCHRADSPEKTSWARPMGSLRTLQRVPGAENLPFDLGRSCNRRILLRELTPRLAKRSGVMADASTGGIFG
jgi:hypothetical protein